ncbi:hypothetical protein H5410_004251 [Solanum commersonii]|uniref:Uncharacterized protein n=1 Tax=Solanum commersonii TaxID=4109 RepID=A0A9J6B760_SOLCO|nr:hypothetical protein H5410_004251 [Solanum commersonii]
MARSLMLPPPSTPDAHGPQPSIETILGDVRAIRIQKLGRPGVRKEMFKVTHAKKSMNPVRRRKMDEPRAQETYSSLFKLQDRKRESLKTECQEPIRGSLHYYPKRRIKRRSLGIVIHHPQALIVGDRETISAMESKIAYLMTKLPEMKERRREKKKKERERRKLRQQKRKYSSSMSPTVGWIRSEGDENDKSDKESEGDENGKSNKESKSDEE